MRTHADTSKESDHELLAAGIDAKSLSHARSVAGRAGGRLTPVLLQLGLIEEGALADAICLKHDLPRWSAPAEPVLNGLNVRFLRTHSAIPIRTSDDNLRLAMADPDDNDALAAINFALGTNLLPVVATFSEIESWLAEVTADTQEYRATSAGQDEDLARILEGNSDAPVIRLVQKILADAVVRRASDVHLEPGARELAVRYRIDGRLIEADRLPAGLALPVASRIKVMAQLDIAESRLPQDGRLRLTVGGRDVDVRVSTSPTAHGESLVLRLLGRSDVPLDLARLGIPSEPLAKLEQALGRPNGIVLLTGPTGSGKSTTLYAALSRLRRPELKLLTVEDPVEVLLEGVSQVQVRPDIGLTYASTLRAFLRQDPDVLMIGEIRDKETAEIALRAALTGHLVLSTLHTNSNLGAFTRLVDIGIEPYLIASTVNAVVAQRLIRTLCQDCRITHPPTSDEISAFNSAQMLIPSEIPESFGCPTCQGVGFLGRVPLFELLEVTPALREAVRSGTVESMANPTPPSETLLGHGLALVAAGRTTVGEVLRAVQAE